MDEKQARALRKAWAEKGSPHCDHNDIEREMHSIYNTHSDYVCNTCGKAHTSRDGFKKTS